jgi:hypothetical protein
MTSGDASSRACVKVTHHSADIDGVGAPGGTRAIGRMSSLRVDSIPISDRVETTYAGAGRKGVQPHDRRDDVVGEVWG